MGPRQLPPRDQVQVFGSGETQRWHAAVIAADSVSGIPWREPIDCDSCRIALPMSAVDSIQVGHPTGGFWRGVGLSFGTLLAAMFIICASGGCPSST